MNTIRASSTLRPEVAKNPELMALSKKPMNQLTDDELFRLYTVSFSFPSGVVDDHVCTTCTLCEKRKMQE